MNLYLWHSQEESESKFGSFNYMGFEPFTMCSVPTDFRMLHVLGTAGALIFKEMANFIVPALKMHSPIAAHSRWMCKLKCVNKYHMVYLIKGHLCVPNGLYMTI